jgi:hypothetical protein
VILATEPITVLAVAIVDGGSILLGSATAVCGSSALQPWGRSVARGHSQCRRVILSIRRRPLDLAAEGRGPLLHARVGILRAMNHGVERVFRSGWQGDSLGKAKAGEGRVALPSTFGCASFGEPGG